jgi:hypothetical protein
MKLISKQKSIGLIVLGIWILSISFMMHSAFAAPTCPSGTSAVGGTCLPSSDPSGVTTNTSEDLSTIVLQVVNIALGFAALFAIAAIIYGGFLYIFDGGNAKMSEKGKKVLINAAIGLVIIILSYTIVAVVSNTVTQIGSGSS